MDDTFGPQSWARHEGTEASDVLSVRARELTDLVAEPTLETQARRSCDAAALRYRTVSARLESLEAEADSSAERARAREEARLHLDAAKLAWFNTVVHYERVKARHATRQ